MEFQKVIEYKLQMLIELMLTDGVSPAELSNNIFEKDYINISFSKKNEYVVGKLNFYDNGNILKEVQMIYTYSKDKVLLRVEETLNGQYSLLWDRKSREEELLEELVYFMKCCYNGKQIEKFISSLPVELRSKVAEYVALLIA